MSKKQPGRSSPNPAQQSAVARPAATSVQPPKAAKPAAPPATKGRPFKVRATQMGYYDHIRRRLGDVFVIQGEHEFSGRWMEKVDASTPERITTPNQAIKQQHDDILAMRHAGNVPQGSMQVGDDNVPDDLPDGTDNPLGAQ